MTMKKFVTLLVSVIFYFGLIKQAQADFLEEFEIGMQGAYRLDELDWNIAADFFGSTPNILSELTWSDLVTYQISTNGQMVAGNKDFPALMKFRWEFGYGFIVGGENQDSDYAGNNRTLEFSRSNNNSDDGSMIDVTIGVGPHFYSANKRLNWSILVGFSYHEQNLTMTDGNQTLSNQANADLLGMGIIVQPLGPFPGLDSTYETHWWGPWIGSDLEIKPSDKFIMRSFIEFHLTEYEAKADWNLRTTGPFALQHPVSFEHWGSGDFGPSDGYGIVAGLNFIFNLSKSWALNIGTKFQQWKIENGISRTYPAIGSPGDTRLNEVNWDSISTNVGITYRFL